ncbi:MAG: hypothetical protein ABIF82_05220 [Planctomycetota bacterium]
MPAVPSKTWRMLAEPPAHEELPKGLDAAWDAAAGIAGRLVPRRGRFLDRAAEVVALEKEFGSRSDAKLREAAADPATFSGAAARPRTT